MMSLSSHLQAVIGMVLKMDKTYCGISDLSECDPRRGVPHFAKRPSSKLLLILPSNIFSAVLKQIAKKKFFNLKKQNL